MRVYLRDKVTGFYYAGSDHWVPAPSKALNFEEVQLATDRRDAEHLSRAETVLDYDEPGLRSPFNFKALAQNKLEDDVLSGSC